VSIVRKSTHAPLEPKLFVVNLDVTHAAVVAAMSHEITPYLVQPGVAFNCAELQQQFFGMSARDVYALLCKRSGCEPVSAVTMLLPDKSGVWDTTELDLSKSYIGHRGVVPLMELCKLLHKLTDLNLSNNFLTNKSVWHVCKMATFHPTLRSVDVSRNDITWTAGMCILELVMRNPSVLSVNLTQTLIKPAIVEAITTQIRRNLHSGNRQHRRGPHATNHPLAIRQRALKRFYRDAVTREGASDGRLPKMFLADGYKEMLRLAGREKEIDQRSPNFFAGFVQRCPSETLDWEVFMLLIMIEEIIIDSSLIEHLRQAFHAFDSDGAGYVELADMKAIITMTTGLEPSDADIAAKLSFYAADSSMTVTWDEFLLFMYDRGPVIGEQSASLANTTLKRPKAHHH
jgi:Ca2+-binding EF-hand superfamily protein